MLAAPRMLSILTTRRCTAQCDHCCVGASPRATAVIPVPRIHRLIDEAKRIPSMERVVFTGGECFLLGRDLDALIAHAVGNEFVARVVSNGYWAVDARAAERRVAALRSAGLTEMMLSTGTFHQRFVPVERVIAAARAAAAAGIVVRVSVEDCDQQASGATAVDEALADLAAQGRVIVVRAPWIPDAGGRGVATLSHTGMAPGAAVGSCAQVTRVLSVTPDQELVACCGYPLEELPRLRIGSVAERALDEVVRDAPDELIKMWLHVSGPSGIAEFVRRHEPGFALPAFASVCQACVHLQRDARAMHVVIEHAGEIAAAVATAFSRLHANREPATA